MSYPVMSTSVPWSLVKSGFKKTPHFDSVTQKTAARRGMSTISLMPYCTWDFEVDLEAVLGGEAISGSVLQSFLGLFLATCGAGGFFLFTDPIDSAVTTAQGVMLNVTPAAFAPMGQVGDGSSTQFQLARTIGQGVDILQNVSLTQVNVNGTPTSAYSVSSTGVVTFTTAPAAAATITWAGSFQYLCLFDADTLQDLARVNRNTTGFLWSCGAIKFGSVFV
jgi:uncharacterized protein (TIGR02217 family)